MWKGLFLFLFLIFNFFGGAAGNDNFKKKSKEQTLNIGTYLYWYQGGYHQFTIHGLLFHHIAWVMCIIYIDIHNHPLVRISTLPWGGGVSLLAQWFCNPLLLWMKISQLLSNMHGWSGWTFHNCSLICMDEVDEHFTIAFYMHGWSGWTFHNCSLHAWMKWMNISQLLSNMHGWRGVSRFSTRIVMFGNQLKHAIYHE